MSRDGDPPGKERAHGRQEYSAYDCATVKSAVRKHNAAHMARRGLNMALAPFPLRKGGGLQVRLSF